MPANRKLDQTISEWLEADAPRQLPDRVLRSTFERTRRGRQQGGWRALLGRLDTMNRTFLAVGGAAAIVIASAIVFSLVSRPNSSIGGTPLPTTVPTTTPTKAPQSPGPTVAAPGVPVGSFVLWSRRVSMTVTIPATSWFGSPSNGILVKNDIAEAPTGAGLIVFDEALYVYGDPCHWSTTRAATAATTVDAFVAAIGAQKDRGATTPVDITVDGHSGKSITIRTPIDTKFADCDQGTYGSWTTASETTPARYSQSPGQIEKLWVVDVNGQLVVIDTAYYDGTPRAAVDEMDAIVNSTTFK
jgi:hypothetical protein